MSETADCELVAMHRCRNTELLPEDGLRVRRTVYDQVAESCSTTPHDALSVTDLVLSEESFTFCQPAVSHRLVVELNRVLFAVLTRAADS